MFVDEIICNRTYDVACWPETKAGDSFTQDCPFLLFRSGGNPTSLMLLYVVVVVVVFFPPYIPTLEKSVPQLHDCRFFEQRVYY